MKLNTDIFAARRQLSESARGSDICFPHYITIVEKPLQQHLRLNVILDKKKLRSLLINEYCLICFGVISASTLVTNNRETAKLKCVYLLSKQCRWLSLKL